METQTKEDTRAKDQAKAQFESIEMMVKALNSKSDKKREEAIEAIQNDPLSVEVKKHYEILLCWGGPACRITGEIGEHDEPETAVLQYQDWGTLWTNYQCDEDKLLEYARQFYYGQ